MTKAEWQTGTPVQLLRYLNRPPADRKLWLYGVACCRAHGPLLTQRATRNAIDWIERYADDQAKRDEEYERLEYASEGAAFRLEASEEKRRAADWIDEAVPLRNLRGQLPHSQRASETAAAYFANALMTLDKHEPYDPTLSAYRPLLLEEPLRDIFGNPFQPVTFVPKWRTDTSVALAAQMYESRDFSAMPVLADAFQDAGCTSDYVLNHCREPGEHVRGCWVVDLVLGKA